MRRRSPCILLGWCGCALAASGPLLTEGVNALQRGDFALAEQKLRAELQAHPDDIEALSFLGATLDNENKPADADVFHKRALALAPRSNSILDKYGSHLLVMQDASGARQAFLKSLAINPADGYANLQLAQMALNAKDGAEALRYLSRLSTEQAAQPEVALRSLLALQLSGRKTEAGELAAKFRNDAAWSVSAGRALADAGELSAAEVLLENALTANPDSFPLLFSLGVVASHTGHYTRSQQTLEASLRQQPGNTDVLYSLAYTYDANQQPGAALRLLSQAAQLAPGRVDLQKSLAIAAANLGDYQTAAAAWEAYGQLVPSDDTARRERGFAKVHLGQFDTGLADLRWYATRHPEDAEAWYELGIAESSQDPTAGMSSLDKAVALRPDFAEARSARGALYYREGKPESALPDLEFAASNQPGNALHQARLGQIYLALDRLNDALRHFRRAAELAPGDYQAQFHLANALAEAGQMAESDAIMAKIRNWPARGNAPTGNLLDH